MVFSCFDGFAGEMQPTVLFSMIKLNRLRGYSSCSEDASIFASLGGDYQPLSMLICGMYSAESRPDYNWKIDQTSFYNILEILGN